jgi:hypothetical protein
MFYGDCAKMREDFALKFGAKELAVPLPQRTISRFLFRQAFLRQRQHHSRPLPTLLA